MFIRTTDHLRLLDFVDEAGAVQRVETTDEHPFWVVERGDFVEARDLRTGDTVQGPAGELQRLASIEREVHPAGIAVYNFEVEGLHDYYVLGKETRGPPVLVHNANGYTKRQIKNARQRGVNRAKSAERKLVQSGHPGTADRGGWTWAERKQIAETGTYPSDVRWHHINDVKNHPQLADVPDNVLPSRGGTGGHVDDYHPNGTQAGSVGDLLDREGIMEGL